jgi:hypothetical protein
MFLYLIKLLSMKMWRGIASCACCFTLAKRVSSVQGSWVDPRAGLEAVDKRKRSS